MISGFDDRVVDLILSHPSIILGTADRTLTPCMARGYGARLIDGGTSIDVMVGSWPGPQTRENLLTSGRVAVTFTAPETFAARQIKGRVLDCADCTPEDLVLTRAYTEVIVRRIEALGELPEQILPTFVAQDPFRLRFAPEVIFDQSPGQGAGQQL